MSNQPIGAGDAQAGIVFPMNDGHRRRVASTYQHVEDLLRKAEAILSGAESQPPFGQVVLDMEPRQREIFQESAAHVRRRLKATLDQFGIASPSACIPASRSAYVLLMGAEIDLEELGGRRLENYGRLSPEEAAALAVANEEILGILKDMRRFLATSSGSGGPVIGAPPEAGGKP